MERRWSELWKEFREPCGCNRRRSSEWRIAGSLRPVEPHGNSAILWYALFQTSNRTMMNIQIFGTLKCQDTRKAQRYFKERRISFQFMNSRNGAKHRHTGERLPDYVGSTTVLARVPIPLTVHSTLWPALRCTGGTRA